MIWCFGHTILWHCINPPEESTKEHIQLHSLLLSSDTQADSCPQCTGSREWGMGSLRLRRGSSTVSSLGAVLGCHLRSLASQRFQWSALVQAGSWGFSFSSLESHPCVRWTWRRHWTRFQGCQRTPGSSEGQGWSSIRCWFRPKF